MSFNLITFIRILLSLVSMALASGFHRYGKGDDRREHVYTAVLLVCAAASFYFYLELGPQFRNVSPRQIMNAHDFYHYYVGPKYHAEVGYFDLYECTAIADMEAGGPIEPRWNIRNLRTYRFQQAQTLARNSKRCRSLFTAERWESFKSDVRYFSGTMAPSRWHQVLKDKGYNATPVWTAFAAMLTNLIPLGSAAGLYALLSLDYLYAIAALLAVGLTFGRRNGLFVVAFWGVNYMSSTTFVKGSISRLDWLLLLVVALCLLRRKRHAGAGVLAGLAASLRLFPALFFVGLFFKCIWTVIRTRSLPRHYLRFGVAVLLTSGVLLGMTAATGAGRQDWRDFSVKIRGHDEQMAGYRVGFKYALADPDLTSPRRQLERIESRKPVWWAAIGIVLALLFVAAPRVPDHHTMALSFACVFFVTAPTFYYYQMLVIPFMMFLPDRRRPALALGMTGFFAWCVLGYTMRLMWPLGIRLSHALSWSLVVLCAFIFLHAFLVFGKEGRDVPEARSV